MEWPSHNDRTETDTKFTTKEFPYIEPGLVGAATLLEREQGLQWAFLANPRLSHETTAKRLRFGERIIIFPPTHSQSLRSSKTTTKRSAEHGANFLRTYLPDVDIASDIIREHLTHDATRSKELERFDPYSGNTLGVFKLGDQPCESFLVFPTGETNNVLNICTISSNGNESLFTPSPYPVHRFQTPVQQLCLSDSVHIPNLAVRTYGPLGLFTVKRSALLPEGVLIQSVASLTRAELGNESVVDMRHSLSGLLTIGDKGAVYESTVGNSTKLSSRLFQPDLDSVHPQTVNGFWRLSLSADAHTVLAMSSNGVFQLDRRSPTFNSIFTTQSERQAFTCIEDVKTEGTFQLCSTTHLFWLDLRSTSKPLLAYAHGREFDLNLSTTSEGSLTFLTTRTNSLITVYDVSRSNEGLIQLHQAPCLVDSTPSFYQPHTSQLIQPITDGLGFSLFRQYEDGAITHDPMVFPQSDAHKFNIFESDTFSNLKSSRKMLTVDAGPLERQHHTEVNLRGAYNMLFDGSEIDASEEDLKRAVNDFPFYLRNLEVPVQHMLTTYDLAFRAGNEPGRSNRADFLATSALNMAAAFRAVKDKTLDPALAKSSWNKSIVATMKRLDKDIHPDPSKMLETLKKYNLAGSSISPKIRDAEKEAAQQLVVDLVLSSHLFSGDSFKKTADVDYNLESMTEALTLNNEAPNFEFGYLKPLEKPSLHREYVKAVEPLKIPHAVRTLLQGWSATENSEGQMFGEDGPQLDSMQNAVKEPRNIQQNRLPPLIESSTQLVQPSFLFSTQVENYVQDSSQERLISTQILPGVYGGRPTGKKKSGKQRLGGF